MLNNMENKFDYLDWVFRKTMEAYRKLRKVYLTENFNKFEMRIVCIIYWKLNDKKVEFVNAGHI